MYELFGECYDYVNGELSFVPHYTEHESLASVKDEVIRLFSVKEKTNPAWIPALSAKLWIKSEEGIISRHNLLAGFNFNGLFSTSTN
jgi:hypothetical protein